MLTPGKRWRHVIVNTRCSWLHGDARGFRDRDHRTHSSGDYKHRPPIGEHSGLRRYYRERSADPVTIPPELRPVVLRAFHEKLDALEHRLLVIAVCGQHVHALIGLPDDRDVIDRIVGKCKQRASHAVRAALPGSVWAAGGEYRCIRDASHQRNAFEYILDHRDEGAAVWSFRDVPRGDPGLRCAQTPA